MPGDPRPIIPSPEQQEIIDYRGDHLQVIACAGSGKTESIARRIASLIAIDDVEPAAIIAFTFTERAAAALKDRVGKRVAEAKGVGFLDRIGPMFVGTIHGYCLRLLQDEIPACGNHEVMDENRRAGMLSREHKALGLDRLGERHWAPIQFFQRQVEVIENERIASEALEDPLRECYLRYVDMLERYRLFSFGRIISRAVEVLDDPAVYARVHGRLRHLVVDEYQDINAAQEALIRRLAKKPVHLCVVGDDDQSIYAWRGSEIGNILDFHRRYRNSMRITLDRNRRSRPGIIKAAGAFASTIAPRLEKTMRAHRPRGGPEVVRWVAETPHDEAQRIAETIAVLHAGGFRYRDVAVLYRSLRTSAPPLVQALRARGIPLTCAGRST